MNDILFKTIAVMGTLGFTLGIVTGFWPVMLAIVVTAGLMLFLTRRPR